MHPHAQLIQQFYDSFAKLDYEGMKACYHPEIEFKDEVFSLKGKKAGAMWHFLCSSAKDLKVVASRIEANDLTGKARWDAYYTFSRTGRKVHNVIDAQFTFKDGRIYRHEDKFNFWRWTSQALGLTGLLLGWTPMVRNKIKKTVAIGIEKFIAQHPDYQD
jgi:ketosteroid isomerase-like protein